MLTTAKKHKTCCGEQGAIKKLVKRRNFRYTLVQSKSRDHKLGNVKFNLKQTLIMKDITFYTENQQV